MRLSPRRRPLLPRPPGGRPSRRRAPVTLVATALAATGTLGAVPAEAAAERRAASPAGQAVPARTTGSTAPATALVAAPAAAPAAAPDRTRVTTAILREEPRSFLANPPRPQATTWRDEEVRPDVWDPTEQVAVRLDRGREPTWDELTRIAFWPGAGRLEAGRTYVVPHVLEDRPAPPGSPRMVVTGGVSCGTPWGSFTVHELSTQPRRARISFVGHCFRDWEPAIAGEVRVRARARTVDGLVLPGTTRFPLAEPGEEIDLPLAVQNLGPRDVAIGKTRVTGRHAADFDTRQTCRTVRAGRRCVIHAVFDPRGAGKRRATLRLPAVRADGTTEVLTSALRGTGARGVTRGRFQVSVPGYRPVTTPLDPIHHPRALVDPDRGTIGIGSRHYASSPAGMRLTAGPTGGGPGPLRPGRYEVTGLYDREPERPWFDSFGNTGHCSDVEGVLDVQELTFTALGQLRSLRLTYDQTCLASNEEVRVGMRMRGHVSFHADRIAPRPDDAPSIAVRTSRRTYREGATVRVRAQVRRAVPEARVRVRVRFEGRRGTRWRVVATEPVGEDGVVRARIEGVRRGSVVRAELLDEPWRTRDSARFRVRR